MGKRELLLVLGFVIVGTLVYQVTAPAAAPGQQGFSIGRLVDRIRREVSSNRASKEVTSSKTFGVKPTATELRMLLRAESLTITGEERDDIAYELAVRSTGVDDAEAERLAGETAFEVKEAGDRISIDLSYPEDGRQYAKVVLKVPARLRLSVSRYAGKLNVSGMAEVELVETRGDATVREVRERLSATHTGGELTVADSPGGRISVRGTDARFTRMTGDLSVQSQGGEVIVADLLGSIEINSNGTDVTFEKLEKASGPIRVTASNGTIKLAGVRTETRVDARNSEVRLAMAAPAAVSVYNEGGEPVDVTPPRGGYQLDALSTDGGRIVLPDSLLTVTTSGDEQRAAGAVGGGGPTITLRATRGEIVLRSPDGASSEPAAGKDPTVVPKKLKTVTLTRGAAIGKLPFPFSRSRGIVISTAPLLETTLDGLTLHRRGKVRDVYEIGDQLLIVATDRISAFDYVLGSGIPDKGKVLTQLSGFWFERMGDLVAHHLASMNVEEFPEPARRHADVLRGRTMLVRRTEPVPIECVARGYLSGSGWKEYQKTGSVCGIALPAGLRESDRLPEPIFTPATKAESGHDENISEAEAGTLVGAPLVRKLKTLTLEIYRRGVEHALSKGIIIADTKFEFGLVGNEIVLIDEVLTPDSSRFWPRAEYEPGHGQPSFDKQFVRDYLEEIRWNKQPPVPSLPEDVVRRTREKYVEAFRLLSGRELQ